MNTTGDIIINIPDQGKDPVFELLTILLPSIITPIIGLCSWIVRGYYDRRDKLAEQHRDKKRKYLITSLSNKLKVFYWPLYLNLIRYRQLIAKYNDFREGKFSLNLSTKEAPSPVGDVRFHEDVPNVSIQITEIDPLHVRPDHHDRHDRQDHIDRQDHHEKNSSEEKNIHTPKQAPHLIISEVSPDHSKGIGFKGAIRILDQFNQAMGEYENKMMDMLRAIQEIYTSHTPIVEPSSELLEELVKLDQYINYITTFKKLSDQNPSDSAIEEKMLHATFPSNIIRIIESQLQQNQSMYNDLINNYNSPVIDRHSV